MDITTLAYIDSNGYFFADYPAFLAWIQDQYRTIYGADVYLEADSQDGQFLAILAKAFYDTAALGASVYNSFSPVSAQGAGLARNVKINGINKRVATNSTVDLTVVGQAGTSIVNGVAIDTLEQKWNLPSPTLIPGGGSIIVTATAQEIGAVNAAGSTVNRIFTPTRGWQTVNNVSAATPGVAVETDAALRARQAISTANPSLTVFEGTQGAVANLAGVTQVRGYENDTDSTDGNGLTPHSISLVVNGGVAVDIATAIARKKTPGTNTYGDVTNTVYDSRGMPLSISFFRPTVVTISVRITLASKTGWTTDYETSIAAAVAAIINANGIGNTILLTKLFAPAYLLGTFAGTTFDISLIELKKGAGAFAAANVAMGFKELPSCVAATDITFVVT